MVAVVFFGDDVKRGKDGFKLSSQTFNVVSSKEA